MADWQITCIIADGIDPGRRIDAVGGAFGVLPIDQAIAWIRSGEQFHTYVGGQWARVYIAGMNGLMTREYLTTSPDGILPNNLLLLPRCA
jgi:hypothetical protein